MVFPMAKDSLIFGHGMVTKQARNRSWSVKLLTLNQWYKWCCAYKRIYWDSVVPANWM